MEYKPRAVLAVQEAQVLQPGQVWHDQHLGNATVAYFRARTIVVVYYSYAHSPYLFD